MIDDSIDKTPKIARDLGAIVYTEPALLGEKRYLQAKYSETEWIASIDSDVFVFPNWNHYFSNKIGSDVGVVNGFLESHFKKEMESYDQYTKFLSYRNYKKTGIRPTMSNNLIRRDLLLKLKEDLTKKNVHAGEDAIIARKINDMGYKTKVITTPTAFHYHYDPFEHHFMAYKRMGTSLVMKDGLVGIFKSLGLFCLAFYNLLIFSKERKMLDFSLYKFVLFLNLTMVKGSLLDFSWK